MKDYTSIKKIIKISVLTIVIIGISIYGLVSYKKQEKKSIRIENNLNESSKKNKSIIKKDNISGNLVVDIKGEIKKPGIYKVNKNTRVIDVINLAGGLTEQADTSVINLSKKITDEMVIIIYSKDEIYNFIETKQQESIKQSICDDGEIVNGACISNEDGNNSENKITGKLNINTATIEELQTLPGIGETKAKNIIEYRNNNGNFTKIEDVLEVPGIGNSIYDQIKENITVK